MGPEKNHGLGARGLLSKQRASQNRDFCRRRALLHCLLWSRPFGRSLSSLRPWSFLSLTAGGLNETGAGRGLPQGTLTTLNAGVCVPFLFGLTPALSSQLGSGRSGVVIGGSRNSWKLCGAPGTQVCNEAGPLGDGHGYC